MEHTWDRICVLGAGNALGDAPQEMHGGSRWSCRGARRRGRGEPFKAIAALELFASLLSLMIFSHGWKKQLRGSVVISGFTDNAGNEAEGFHWRSSRQSWPSSFSRVNSTFSLSWVPREQN